MFNTALSGLGNVDWGSFGGGGGFTPTPSTGSTSYGPWQNPMGAGPWADKYSDKRLKKNINLIGKSPNGLNIYSFEYKNPQYGE